MSVFEDLAPTMGIRESQYSTMKTHQIEEFGVDDFGGRDFDLDDGDAEFINSLGYDRLIPDDSY